MGKSAVVTVESEMMCTVTGPFYRAVNPAFADHALDGSVREGRYSSANQPTLYLSSSPEGVDAAMIAHQSPDSPPPQLITATVSAHKIFDLRDDAACHTAGIRRDHATADWRETLAAGGTPTSWQVRDRLEELGAHGLIDPSRKAPGLWHLVLFDWNTPDAPQVKIAGEGTSSPL